MIDIITLFLILASETTTIELGFDDIFKIALSSS